MARACEKIAAWPVPLRWVVAMLVVPVVPFAAVFVFGAFLWLLEAYQLLIPLVPLGFATLYFVPFAWLFFLPVYFAVNTWGRHSKKAYVRAAMLAAVAGALLLTLYANVMDPYPSEAYGYVVLGLVIGLPTAALMGAMIWCVLWSGRQTEDTPA